MTQIEYHIEPNVSDIDLNGLFASTWDKHKPRTFKEVLKHSLTYICAFDDSRLIGFVNVAWNGGIHRFFLDTTVHPDYQRQGIGGQLVKTAAEVSKERGIEWLHVDFVPQFEAFYRSCGFKKTKTGLLNLTKTTDSIPRRKRMSFCTAINCMDGRVQLPVISFLKQRFNVAYVDVITEPGPNLILSKQTDRELIESIFQRLEISVNKHHSVATAIVGHHDCAGNPSSKDEQISHLHKAANHIHTRYPNIEIITLWVDEHWQVNEVPVNNSN